MEDEKFQSKENMNNYSDTYLLSYSEIEGYDLDILLLEIHAILKNFKKVRNIYYNGVHVRLIASYVPILEQRSKHNTSNPVADAVTLRLDSIDEYNKFNEILYSLYKIMTREEIAYINDCLICDR